MKRILGTLIVFMFIVLPFNNLKVFAYSGGLLDKQPVYVGNSFTVINGTLTKPTDGNLTAYDTLGSQNTTNDMVWYKFSTPQTISSYILKSSSGIGAPKLQFFDANKTLISEISSSNVVTTYTQTNITPVNNVTYVVLQGYADVFLLYEWDVFSGSKTVPHEDLSNFSLTPTYNKVDLSWSLPSQSGVSGIKVYRNGSLIKTLSGTSTAYSDTNVDPETTYSYTVSVLYSDGFETTGSTKNVTTTAAPKPPANVADLEGTPYLDRVELYWKNPDLNFSKAYIYKDGVKVSETSGTTFIDSDVTFETTYTYKITTVSPLGLESEGVAVSVTTPKEPIPVVTNPNYEIQPNGDLKITWDQPTTGTMKIIVGGEIYSKVDSSNQEYIVPAADVKTTILGDVEAGLQPVSKSGLEGEKVAAPKTTNPKVPFTASDLIESSNGLLWLIGPFVLLALSFLLVPKLRNLIINAFARKSSKTPNEGRRFEGENRERTERLDKIEKLEKEPKEQVTKEEKKENIRLTREPRATRMRAERAQRIKRETRQPRERGRLPREPRQRRGMK